MLEDVEHAETFVQLLRGRLLEVGGVHRVDAVAETIRRDVVQRDTPEGAPHVRLLVRFVARLYDGAQLVQLRTMEVSSNSAKMSQGVGAHPILDDMLQLQYALPRKMRCNEVLAPFGVGVFQRADCRDVFPEHLVDARVLAPSRALAVDLMVG